MTVEYCEKCCQRLTRPKLSVEDGVCGACKYEESKKTIDWDARFKELRGIAEWAKREADKRGTHDCISGVSGGKDSTFVSMYAKEKLGLNVLLVNAAPDLITPIGRHNIDNLIGQGFDCVTISVNPKILKKLMRRDFFKHLQLRICTEFPVYASVYIMAKKLNIPMVVNGENPALTLGVSADLPQDGDASQVFRVNTVAGRIPVDEYSDLIKSNEVSADDFYWYTFPDLSDWDGKACWIQYYAPEWSQAGNALYARMRGLKFREDDMHNLGRIHPWTALDSDFHMVNQMLKYAKFGFGFTTDEVCYDIREGRLTREEGFKLIEEFDGLCGEEYIKKFCDYIDITEHDFWENVYRWAKYTRKEWMEK